MILNFLILVLLRLGYCTADSDPMTRSSSGEYKGTIMKNSFDKPIFAFRGIRYAEPPVGKLRFKPAVPVKSHEGVFDATNDPPACPQSSEQKDPTSEDCLFLNVYSTKLPTEEEKVKRPVLVFIHPSAFQEYSSRSNWFGPEYLMNRDIVLVTFNYRLGVLGFISTGDKQAPGNLGLKDQVEVLRWVKRNIEGFGGDPNDVTIYGVGSGGMSVSLHLVSPLSKGLFHKTILSTGSFTGVYPVGKSKLKLTQCQAKVVGCQDDSTSSMVECLKKKPADELGNSVAKLNPSPKGIPIWTPVIEEDFGQERFLTDHPVKLILEGEFHHVPMLMGYNSDQFSNLAIDLVTDSEKLKKFDEEFENEAAKLFSYEHENSRVKAISQDLRSFYFGDEKIDNSTLPQLKNLYNDGLIGNEMHRLVTLLAKKSKESIFFYLYSYLGQFSHFHPKEGHSLEGPILNDDLIYIFHMARFPKIEKGDPEFTMVRLINSAIGQFVSTGNPNRPNATVKLEPYDLKNQHYFENAKQPGAKKGLYEKRFAEWDKLFPLTKYDIVPDSSPTIEICH